MIRLVFPTLAALGALAGLAFLPASADTRSPARTVTNSIGMKFAYVPPGKFRMGSPASEKGRSADEKEHEVEITSGFYLGAHEVTQAQYEKVMGHNPSQFSSKGDRKDRVKGLDTKDFPVENVSWENAQQFIEKLNALKAESENKRVYRLPTEAEWEYACRGGATKKAPFHFGSSLTAKLANFNDNKKRSQGPNTSTYLGRPTRVGSYKANGYGLYDMHGNVYEWCQDYYDEKFYAKDSKAVKDPVNTREHVARAIRGGGWNSWQSTQCRSAFRGSLFPSARVDYCGFRVLLVADK